MAVLGLKSDCVCMFVAPVVFKIIFLSEVRTDDVREI